MTRLASVAASSGGWVLFHLVDGVDGAVRCERAEDGRLHPVQLVTSANGRPLRGVDLREFPLGALEAAANGELHAELLRHYDDTHAVAWRRHNKRVRDELPALTAPARTAPNLTLGVPPTRPYPDDFFGDVAVVYQRAAAASSRPAADIAEANGVTVRQVHGWVAEARRRGHLQPGRRGRVG